MLKKNNSFLLIDCEIVEKEVKALKEKLNEETEENIDVNIDEVLENIKKKLNTNTYNNAIICNIFPRQLSFEIEYSKIRNITNKSPGSIV